MTGGKLSNSFDCCKIPVRFVNHIQNFGILIGVEKKSHLISHVSENIETAFGVPGHTLLGKSIFLPELAPPLKKIAYFIQQDTQKLSSQEPIDTDEDHELIFHKQDKYDLFEWLFFKKKPENEMNCVTILLLFDGHLNCLEIEIYIVCMHECSHVRG